MGGIRRRLLCLRWGGVGGLVRWGDIGRVRVMRRGIRGIRVVRGVRGGLRIGIGMGIVIMWMWVLSMCMVMSGIGMEIETREGKEKRMGRMGKRRLELEWGGDRRLGL